MTTDNDDVKFDIEDLARQACDTPKQELAEQIVNLQNVAGDSKSLNQAIELLTDIYREKYFLPESLEKAPACGANFATAAIDPNSIEDYTITNPAKTYAPDPSAM